MLNSFFEQNELIPCIAQDALSLKVLMLGYMNKEAYEKSIELNRLTFFSRSRQRLWTKGESSGNFLQIQSLHLDCDQDSILAKVIPAGPVCHTGKESCFDDALNDSFSLLQLEGIIQKRIAEKNPESYSFKTFSKGRAKLAQKCGEEAVEFIIESIQNNSDRFKEESADFLYHFLLLCHEMKISLKDIEHVLGSRHANSKKTS